MQEITSANTSINSTRIPKLFGALNLSAEEWFKKSDKPKLLDYGSGKYTYHIKQFVESYGWEYHPYDPFNELPIINEKSIKLLENKEYSLVVCSNVLNVLDNPKSIYAIVSSIEAYTNNFAFSIYEGTRSGIGKVTKKDCYQQNKKTKDYLVFFTNAYLKGNFIVSNLTILK